MRPSALLLLLVFAIPTLAAASSDMTPTTFSAPDVPMAPSKTSSGEATRARLETAAAINPTDPTNLIGAAMDWNWQSDHVDHCRSCGVYGPGVYVSKDGGASWSAGFVPLVRTDGSRCEKGVGAGGDVTVVFDALGRAYYGLLGGCGGSGVWVARSDDGGTTWNDPVRAVKPGKMDERFCGAPDKPWLSYDPAGDQLMVVWTNFQSDCNDGTGGHGAIYFVASKDHGKNWSAPVRVSPQEGHGAIARATPDGRLHIAYVRSASVGTCPSTWFTQANKQPAGERMVVATSADDGAMWTETTVATVCDPWFTEPKQPLAMQEWLNAMPTFSIDPATGLLALAWTEGRDGDSIIVVATSTDAATWTVRPVGVHTNFAAFIPAIAAADGRIHLVYALEDSAGLVDFVYRESPDGGNAWTQRIRLTSQSSNAAYFLIHGPIVTQPWRGHYMGIDAAAGVVFPVWADERSADAGETVYTRIGRYPFEAAGPIDADLSPLAERAMPSIGIAFAVVAIALVAVVRRGR